MLLYVCIQEKCHKFLIKINKMGNKYLSKKILNKIQIITIQALSNCSKLKKKLVIDVPHNPKSLKGFYLIVFDL